MVDRLIQLDLIGWGRRLKFDNIAHLKCDMIKPYYLAKSFWNSVILLKFYVTVIILIFKKILCFVCEYKSDLK